MYLFEKGPKMLITKCREGVYLCRMGCFIGSSLADIPPRRFGGTKRPRIKINLRSYRLLHVPLSSIYLFAVKLFASGGGAKSSLPIFIRRAVRDLWPPCWKWRFSSVLLPHLLCSHGGVNFTASVYPTSICSAPVLLLALIIRKYLPVDGHFR